MPSSPVLTPMKPRNAGGMITLTEAPATMSYPLIPVTTGYLGKRVMTISMEEKEMMSLPAEAAMILYTVMKATTRLKGIQEATPCMEALEMTPSLETKG